MENSAIGLVNYQESAKQAMGFFGRVRYRAAGRAIVLHETLDDCGQPTGNAGGRIGGGVILITGP